MYLNPFTDSAIEKLGFELHYDEPIYAKFKLKGEQDIWLLHSEKPLTSDNSKNTFKLIEYFSDGSGEKTIMDWAEINDIGQLEWMLACFGVIEVDFLDDVREALKRIASNLKLIEPRGKAEEIHKDLDILLKRLCEEQKEADFSIYEKITKK